MTEREYYEDLARWLAKGELLPLFSCRPMGPVKGREEPVDEDYRRAQRCLIWHICHPQAVREVAQNILRIEPSPVVRAAVDCRRSDPGYPPQWVVLEDSQGAAG